MDGPAKSQAERKLVGKRLASWRKAAGLKQEQVATLLNVTMITLQRQERGTAEITYQQLRHYADLYGRDWREVLSDHPRGADFRSIPAFHLVVHPGALMDEDLRREAELAIESLNAKYLRRARRREGVAENPLKPGSGR